MSEIKVNPEHPVDGEIAKAVRAYREEGWRRADDELELTKLMRPTEEERRFKEGVRERMLRSAGVDVVEFLEQRERFRKESQSRMTVGDHALPVSEVIDLTPLEWAPLEPRAADPSFWFASSRWFGDSPYTGSFDADGLSFKGLKNHNSGNLIGLRFGYTSLFELHANRIPHSPTGRWRSSPMVEIFGALIGSSQDSFGWGDDWCKCHMVMRQTAFQFVFAPPGASNRRVIADRTDVTRIFFSEDAPFTGFRNFRGQQFFPSLVLTHPLTAQSIWVEVELRFDIQLEGSAQLWIDPQQRFVTRGSQWPAVPI